MGTKSKTVMKMKKQLSYHNYGALRSALTLGIFVPISLSTTQIFVFKLDKFSFTEMILELSVSRAFWILFMPLSNLPRIETIYLHHHLKQPQ